MTAAFGLRTCALALTLAVVVRAQPVPDMTGPAASQSAWNGTCSLSVHGAVVRWAVGDSGRVLRMVDGDTTARYVVGMGQLDLCGVSFADPKHGWIVGNKREDPERGRGVVFRTTAGGSSPQEWTATFPATRPGINVPFLQVLAIDAMQVWVTCGDRYALRSNDGGLNWLAAAKRPTADTVTKSRNRGAPR